MNTKKGIKKNLHYIQFCRLTRTFDALQGQSKFGLDL